jgi:hypothetical protein
MKERDFLQRNNNNMVSELKLSKSSCWSIQGEHCSYNLVHGNILSEACSLKFEMSTIEGGKGSRNKSASKVSLPRIKVHVDLALVRTSKINLRPWNQSIL